MAQGRKKYFSLQLAPSSDFADFWRVGFLFFYPTPQGLFGPACLVGTPSSFQGLLSDILIMASLDVFMNP